MKLSLKPATIKELEEFQDNSEMPTPVGGGTGQ